MTKTKTCNDKYFRLPRARFTNPESGGNLEQFSEHKTKVKFIQRKGLYLLLPLNSTL